MAGDALMHIANTSTEDGCRNENVGNVAINVQEYSNRVALIDENFNRSLST